MSSSSITNSNYLSNINISQTNSKYSKIRNKSSSNKLTISNILNNKNIMVTNNKSNINKSNNNNNNIYIIKSYKDKNKNINLNTIFSLPKIKKKIFKQNSYKFLGNNSARKIENIEKNPLIKNLINSADLSNYSGNNYNNINKNDKNIILERFMKKKYYEDIEKFTINKMIRKNWFNGSKTQNQVLKIHKVTNFWKGICDYSLPHFNIEKFKMKKNNFSEKNVIKEEIKNENKKLPNLFTSDVLSDLRHKLRTKKKNEFYKKLNKIEELKNLKLTFI